MTIYDITLPLQSSLACWPGDTPTSYRKICTLAEGASVNLGTVEMSVHAGTHADAPYHFQDDGKTMEALSLTPYIGPALVVDMQSKTTIRQTDLEALPLERAPRVLFKTGGWTDHTQFPTHIPTLEPGAATYLRSRGVVLIGLDVPSVDDIDSKTLPIHHEIGGCGIHILESLDLAQVPPGEYELIALPLKLVGADGAPARAVLIRRGMGA